MFSDADIIDDAEVDRQLEEIGKADRATQARALLRLIDYARNSYLRLTGHRATGHGIEEALRSADADRFEFGEDEE